MQIDGPARERDSEREGTRADALANCPATQWDGTSLNYSACRTTPASPSLDPCHSYPCSLGVSPILRPLVTWPYGPPHSIDSRLS
ncbi:hypothetical protein OG21DRAFT_1518519 [Imleria badia]|nr:hypothetical protein OG21DRAFT_1518519 [Imleria badia]